MTKTYLLPIAVLASLSLGFIPVTASAQSDWKTFTHEKYSIQYPKNWNASTPDALGQVEIVSPIETAKDTFRESVNIVIQDLGVPVPVEELGKGLEAQVTTSDKNNVVLQDKYYDSGPNGPYVDFMYIGQVGKQQTQFRQFIVMKGTVMYIVIFNCEPVEFKNYEELSQKIFDSMKIK